MSRTKVPPAIAHYLEGVNAKDAHRASSAFAVDAVVYDEGHEHVGRDAIRTWAQAGIDRYATNLAIENVNEGSDATVVAVRMTGTFPGSPLTVRFIFKLAAEHIVQLAIRS